MALIPWGFDQGAELGGGSLLALSLSMGPLCVSGEGSVRVPSGEPILGEISKWPFSSVLWAPVSGVFSPMDPSLSSSLFLKRP